MGPEEFRIGIKRFLEKFKYGNAVTNDLWRELEGVSSMGLDITTIMDTWTRQMGYPVINVRIYFLYPSRLLFKFYCCFSLPGHGGHTSA